MSSFPIDPPHPGGTAVAHDWPALFARRTAHFGDELTAILSLAAADRRHHVLRGLPRARGLPGRRPAGPPAQAGEGRARARAAVLPHRGTARRPERRSRRCSSRPRAAASTRPGCSSPAAASRACSCSRARCSTPATGSSWRHRPTSARSWRSPASRPRSRASRWTTRASAWTRSSGRSAAAGHRSCSTSSPTTRTRAAGASRSGAAPSWSRCAAGSACSSSRTSPTASSASTGTPRRACGRWRPDVVLQLGTFSKILVPGVRLGWAVGPAAIVSAMTAAKQNSDQCAGALGQTLMTEYLARRAPGRHAGVRPRPVPAARRGDARRTRAAHARGRDVDPPVGRLLRLAHRAGARRHPGARRPGRPGSASPTSRARRSTPTPGAATRSGSPTAGPGRTPSTRGSEGWPPS